MLKETSLLRLVEVRLAQIEFCRSYGSLTGNLYWSQSPITWQICHYRPALAPYSSALTSESAGQYRASLFWDTHPPI
jgi:hypothetical protein